MAGNASDALETEILNATLKNTAAFLPVAAPYIALHTGDPTDAGTANEHPNSSGYARTAATFGTITGGVVSNSAAVTFPVATGDWTAVTYFSIWTSGTYGAGTCLFWGQLTTPRTVTSGNYAQFAIGAISVTST